MQRSSIEPLAKKQPTTAMLQKSQVQLFHHCHHELEEQPLLE
jgi:hypothetical protein